MAKEKQLILEDNSFIFKKERFQYSDIHSLGFVYIQTQKGLTQGAGGIDHNAMLDIYIHSKEKHLSIETGHQGFTFYGPSFHKKSSESLVKKYNELAFRTFDQRLKPYLNSLEKFGYFNYNEKKIFKNGDIVDKDWTKNLLTHAPWLRQPFSIFYEFKKPGFFSRKKKYTIYTTKDEDVFLAILKHKFHLSWKR